MAEAEDLGVEGGVRPAPPPRLRLEREPVAVVAALPARADRVGVDLAAAAGSMATGGVTGVAGPAEGSAAGGSGRAGSVDGGLPAA